MLDVVASNHFRKDLKQIIKRGYRIELLDEVVTKFAAEIPLDEKYRDHALTGNYSRFRECHITPDWLLIYQIREKELVLFLSRTGYAQRLILKNRTPALPQSRTGGSFPKIRPSAKAAASNARGTAQTRPGRAIPGSARAGCCKNRGCA